MNRTIPVKCCAFVAFGCAAISNPAHGQLAARPLGMGLAYTALARGVHAVDWNPANLGLAGNPKFSISFVSAGAGAGNNSFSIDTYNRFATDRFWDSAEIDELLGNIPQGGLGADVMADIHLLSFSVGRFALSIGARGGGFASVDKKLLEIPLLGTRVGNAYRFDKMDASTLAIGSVKLCYGVPVRVSFAEAFSVGWAVHWDYGGAYGRIDSSRLALAIGTYGFNIDGKYSATVAPAGMGWGLDLGAAAALDKHWTVGVGLFNAAGVLHWRRDVRESVGYMRGDSLAVLDLGEDEGIMAKPVQDSSWTFAGKDFDVRIPAVLHMGGLYEEGDFVLTFDMAKGFGDQGWVTRKLRIGFGTEWRKVRWLPLRMGLALGGRIGFGTSFGFGVRTGRFAFDFGFMNRGFLPPNSSKGVFAAVEVGAGL